MNQFPRACGIDDLLRLKVGGQEQTFSRPYVLIGRNPKADLVVNRREIQRLHTYLQAVDGRLFCLDLAGRGGIRWGDGRSATSGWLDPGQWMRVGPLKIRRVDGGLVRPRPGASATNPLEAEATGAPVVLEARLLSSGGITAGATPHRLGHVLTLVGRSPRCGVVLPAQSVSEFHAALLRTAGGLWIVDLLGSGGVAVNGVSVRSARLSDGDELGIGYYAIRVRGAEPSRAAAPGTGLAVAAVSFAAPELAFNPPEFALARYERGDSATAGSLAITRTTTTGFPELVAPSSPVEAGANAATDHDALLEALARMANQFGLAQQRKLEQFLESVTRRYQDATTALLDEQATLREELAQLRRVVEDLAQSPPERPTPASAAAASQARPAEGLPEFYTWLAGRIETFEADQQGRWQSIVTRFLGRAQGEGTAP